MVLALFSTDLCFRIIPAFFFFFIYYYFFVVKSPVSDRLVSVESSTQFYLVCSVQMTVKARFVLLLILDCLRAPRGSCTIEPWLRWNHRRIIQVTLLHPTRPSFNFNCPYKCPVLHPMKNENSYRFSMTHCFWRMVHSKWSWFIKKKILDLDSRLGLKENQLRRKESRPAIQWCPT